LYEAVYDVNERGRMYRIASCEFGAHLDKPLSTLMM